MFVIDRVYWFLQPIWHASVLGDNSNQFPFSDAFLISSIYFFFSLINILS